MSQKNSCQTLSLDTPAKRKSTALGFRLLRVIPLRGAPPPRASLPFAQLRGSRAALVAVASAAQRAAASVAVKRRLGTKKQVLAKGKQK